MIRVIAIVGPTASGKSALAVELAKNVHGEIISADSRQIYTGLNIGTGKISTKEMHGVPHHLLNVADPRRQFSAAQFAKRAQKILLDIVHRGKTPIVAGGTGFYIDVLFGLTSLPNVSPNISLRKKLSRKSPSTLFRMLKKIDPQRARSIDPKNTVRMIRAIEIAHALGKTPTLQKKRSPYALLWIGLQPKDSILREKIHTRLLSRMRQGMIAEAKKLRREGLSFKRMAALGLEYKFLALYLQGKISKKEMLEKLEIAIWQYARRQRTWFRRNKKIQWFGTPNRNAQRTIIRTAKSFLSGQKAQNKRLS